MQKFLNLQRAAAVFLTADPHNGDFTLHADFPAYQIGFEPIDMSDAGIREN